MPQAKKLIEVALPLDGINRASAREKSIRHGHPSTLHLWWARRPLAAARAVIFTSLVDDPDDPNASPDFVVACNALNYGATDEELAGVKRLNEENRIRREKGLSPKTQKRNIPQNVREGNDSPRMRLFDFIERLVEWEATTDETIMEKARELIQIATNGNPPPLLDPFAGGGSIPLEAQRLGLKAHASDLNPVAVMINKAMIEIPPRFVDMPPVNPRDREVGTAGDAKWKGAAGLAADVRYYGEWMREQAFERIGHLYPKHNGETVIAWLWARTVISPNPAVNAPVPLVRSFVLSKKKGRECWAKPVIEGATVRFAVTPGKPPAEYEKGTMGKNLGGGRCVISGEPISWDYVRAEGKAGRIGMKLMAIVTEGKRGRSHYSPTDEHVLIAESAEPAWRPAGLMSTHSQYMLVTNYGSTEWADLFTVRQLTALTTFSDLVVEVREVATRDAQRAGLPEDQKRLRDGGQGASAFGEAVSVYLGMNVSKQANRLSKQCFWDPGGEKVQQVFARQALPMNWDSTEANPFSTSSGNFIGQLDYMLKVLERVPANEANGHALQQDAIRVDSVAQALSTDPPYYDNIPYADISDFFYVWLRRNLQTVYPDLFATLLVPKESELVADHERWGGKEEAKEFFEDGMLTAFTNIRRQIGSGYPLTIYYAFKQQDARPLLGDAAAEAASTGWETMLSSLITAGFSIIGTWPMRTELTGNLKKKLNALASSIVLVCRPRPEDAPATSRRRFLDALRAELPGAIAEMKTGSIAPVDMAQATIGPGMAIYSRYSAVRHADGQTMSVREALYEINRALDEVLEGAVAFLDPETRFAIDWFTQYGFVKGDFGGANTMAQGKNTSVDSVALAGVVEAVGGKVRLINWREYDPSGYEPEQDKRPTVWEGTHHLIERLNSHGETGAAALYNRLPGDIAESVRDLAYRLYHICDREGRAEDALDYNVLVSSWSEITRLAASERGRGTQAGLFDD